MSRSAKLHKGIQTQKVNAIWFEKLNDWFEKLNS